MDHFEWRKEGLDIVDASADSSSDMRRNLYYTEILCRITLHSYTEHRPSVFRCIHVDRLEANHELTYNREGNFTSAALIEMIDWIEHCSIDGGLGNMLA